MTDQPEILGLIGYTLGKDRGQINKGIEFCIKAIKIDSNNIDNYLYLGRLYILAGKKQLAIKTFRSCLKIKKDIRVIEELKQLGIRKPPPFQSLPRDHKLNIVTGKILQIINIR